MVGISYNGFAECFCEDKMKTRGMGPLLCFILCCTALLF